MSSPTFSSANRDLDRILESATPELYRRNAFRVLGLEIGAETSEARRRQKKLKRSEALGLGEAAENGILPLAEAPSREELQQAQQRIQDPLLRLVDEFFWIWPQAEIETDEGMDFLRQGNLGEARRIYSEREQASADATATHNLAVLDHLAALDSERNGKSDSSQASATTRDMAWRNAFRRWRRVIESPETESRLRDRIEELGDPRLAGVAVNSLQVALAEMILLVSARLAIHELEEACPGGLARHVWLLRTSGFRSDLVTDALRRSLGPIDHRLRQAAEKADKETDTAPETGLQVAGDLLAMATPILRSVDAMLPADDATRVGLHDEVARVALRCQIAYGNKTEDWVGSKRLLEQILAQLSPSESIRQRVAENLKTVTHNAAGVICHYCGKTPGANAYLVQVNMHGDVSRTPMGYNQVQVTWRPASIKVPRCAACRQVHQEVAETPEKFAWYALASAAGEIVFGIVAAFLVPRTDAAYGLLLIFMVPVGLATLLGINYLGMVEVEKLLERGTKGFTNVDDHPLIAELKAKDWRFGVSPNDGTTFGPPAKEEDPSVKEFLAPKPAAAAGCPKCSTEHWWKGGSCSLCDAPREEGGQSIDASLDVMIKLLGLGATTMAQVVGAINTGRRGTAAAILMKSGQSAEEAKRIVLGWERRPKDTPSEKS